MMPRVAIKLNDWYLVWSSIVDAPIACCQEDELPTMIVQFFGAENLERLLARLKRTGLSSCTVQNIDSVISYNRAGPKETTLIRDEIYRAYCLKEKIGDWSAYRDEEHNPT